MQYNTPKNPDKPQEKTYYQMRCDFYEKFKEEIAPQIIRLEKKRKEKLNTVITRTIIAAFVFILLIYISATVSKKWINMFGPVYGLLLCGSFSAMVTAYPSVKKEFENKIKKAIMPVICSCYGKLEWYQNIHRVNTTGLEDSFLIPEYTYLEHDDLFKGCYKGVDFSIIETKCVKHSGKERRTVFDGVIVKFKMNKPFNGHTLVRQKSLFHTPIIEAFRGAKLNFATLEDIKFMKKFRILCEDQIEARYLLTTAFIKRFFDMKTAFFADRVDCAFYQNSLFIALHTRRDLFSICSLVKPLNDFEQYKTMYNEIISVYRMIDHFKLDENTGL